MRMGLHHFHIRKRIHKHHEPYPHPDRTKRAVDKMIYIVALVGPLFNVPQLLKIWINQNASGVSAVSWGAFMFISGFWLLYGILHKEKPIIIANIFYMFFHAIILVGAILYGDAPFALY